jgi:hypothetical protein
LTTGVEECSLRHCAQTVSGAHPDSYSKSTWGSFPVGEADHSPPSSTGVKNAWNYTFPSPIRLTLWCSVKAQGLYLLYYIILYHIISYSFLGMSKFSSLSTVFPSYHTFLGSAQALIQWLQGALAPEVKRLRRKGDHSSPSSVEVKKAWSYNSTPPYVFMAWYLVKYRNNFTFTYINCIILRYVIFKSRDSSVGIALGYGLDDRGSRVRFPAEAGNFSLHHRV